MVKGLTLGLRLGIQLQMDSEPFNYFHYDEENGFPVKEGWGRVHLALMKGT